MNMMLGTQENCSVDTSSYRWVGLGAAINHYSFSWREPAFNGQLKYHHLRELRPHSFLYQELAVTFQRSRVARAEGQVGDFLFKTGNATPVGFR